MHPRAQQMAPLSQLTSRLFQDPAPLLPSRQIWNLAILPHVGSSCGDLTALLLPSFPAIKSNCFCWCCLGCSPGVTCLHAVLRCSHAAVFTSESSSLGVRNAVDLDALLCDILQVTYPLWPSLFLMYKVKVLGQIGDRISLHYFLGFHILKIFCPIKWMSNLNTEKRGKRQ